MNDIITLETIHARQDELAAMIAAFNANDPRTINVPGYPLMVRAVDYNALSAQLAEAQRELVAKEAERAAMELERNNAQRQHTTQRAINRLDSQRILELATQLAEAQRDAERLDWIIERRAYIVSDPDCCDGYWLNYARPDGTMWTQATEHETPRAAIDAAKGESDERA